MGYLTVNVDIREWGIQPKLRAAAKRAEHAVAEKAESDTDPYVPMRTGSLKNRTQVVENKIIYPGPYARYLYYGKVMVDSRTGEGPMHFIDQIGNEVIRFRKDATLRPTERDLNIRPSKTSPYAQAYWFEASKAQNLDKWKDVAAKAVKDELK